MEKLSLPTEWIRNIMNCIETTRMSIVLNGKRLKWFKSSRGIRQGDAISPYLFVLYMERLGNIIHSVVDTREWKPVKLSRNDPYLSHLFFADDLILFAEASVDEIKVIQESLTGFV